MNKATVFISTAALMAGTASGVYAEAPEHFSAAYEPISNYEPAAHSRAYVNHEDSQQFDLHMLNR
jgi:hypothetical protein